MVAFVAATLADAELNIIDLKLGRNRSGQTAMMAFSLEQPVPASVVAKLTAAPGILDALAITQD
jgi:predicted regulator of amino acid metabolism with ACT domain